MSETIPIQHAESQPWKQDLLPHHEGYPALKTGELLALMGSWTDQKLESTLESIKELPEADQERQTRVMRAALDELPNLDTEFDVNSTIADRKSQLEAQLKENTRNIPVATKLRTKLAGLDFLLGEHEGIVDNIKLAGRTAAERSLHVNELIAEHNSWVSRGSESLADSLEVQARINARYSEQAKQTQPAETVDDARQKVAEVFGSTREREQVALIDEVAHAAKGTTRIYTDIPKGVMLKTNSGEYRPIDGFNSFGDGLSQNDIHHHNARLEYGGTAEAMIFAPDTTTRYKTVTKTVETGGRFMKKTQQVEEQVPDGEIPTMVVNPSTGQQEPGIKVAYQFNGNSRKENGQTVFYEGPAYTTESGRAGNQLFVEAILPKSVADKLKQGIAGNPEIAREFAKTLALSNGITEEAWNNGVCPPYDKITNDWDMTIADLQKDTQFGDVRHNVVSQLTVKVNR